MNSKQYRSIGLATIFRMGHVYLIPRSDPTIAHIAYVDNGRWMDKTIEEMQTVFLTELFESVQDDIRKTLAACYCDKGVDLCDFCGNVRPVEDAK